METTPGSGSLIRHKSRKTGLVVCMLGPVMMLKPRSAWYAALVDRINLGGIRPRRN
jgi:hypothetical protein